METEWNIALWQQFGAAIDMLDDALTGCPDSLWTARLWPGPPPPYFPRQFGEFWYIGFHTVVWLDLYLAGVPEDEFAPPAPFPRGEMDSNETLPSEPYAKEIVRTYLAATRERSRRTFESLTTEQAQRHIVYPWTKGRPVSYLELQLYNLRHIQEHAAQLSLFLGQHGVSDAGRGWVAQARTDDSSQ